MPAFKQGLDWWPRSVQLVRDPKLRTPKMIYGYLAVMVYELLLDLLYEDKGYYIDYSRKEDVIWAIMEGLMGKYQPTCETIEEIIERLVACELFSGDHFKRKTITSSRAQRTFYSATVDRKMVNIDFRIWMLSEAEMRALSSRSVILAQFLRNRTINEQNRSINEGNRSILPQSRVENSRVKKSKEEKESGATAPTHSRSIQHGRGKYGWVKLSDDEYNRLISEYGESEVGFYITYIDESAQQTGNKNEWKDWDLTIRKAIRNKWGDRTASAFKNYNAGEDFLGR